MGVIRFKDGSNMELTDEQLKKVAAVLDSYTKTGSDSYLNLPKGRLVLASSIREIEITPPPKGDYSKEEITAIGRTIEKYMVDGRLPLKGEMQFLEDRGAITYNHDGTCYTTFAVLIKDPSLYQRLRDLVERYRDIEAWKRQQDKEAKLKLETK